MSKSSFDDTLKSSLEYYDSFQPKVIEILSKTEYILFKDNKNITDEIIFFDKNKKKILQSAYEYLAVYVPSSNTWKWAWSLPTSKKKSNFISRKILEYAFNLEQENDFLLKTTLINSKIQITNQLQLDLYVALSASLSKKPFILKTYLSPMNNVEKYKDKEVEGILIPLKKNDNVDTMDTTNTTNNADNADNPDNFITLYLFILDFQ